ncbi:amidase [Leucobacter musarum]|uniref:amidase n=1 Tax=Leucobacter musarum TaxID=1930747 RepID=UPI0006A7A115|nr:amidase [Leucobacter musarum]
MTDSTPASPADAPLPSAVAWRDALRSGEISARDAVTEVLHRAEHCSDLGAFVALDSDLALEQAAAADAHFANLAPADRAHALPRLHGLPTAFKDLTEVTGFVTTRGSAALPHARADNDAPGVAVLRRAGAIPIGKTQVPELGLTGYSENAIAAPARNPLDPERTAGGSSGGSAAGVAAGMLPVAPGSDGGGSIRIPALACGLVGLKPGLGAVPSDLAGGTPADRSLHDEFGAPRLAVTGPLARDAADAALLFDAQRGATGEPALAAVRTAGSVTGLRIGASTVSPFAPVYPIVLSAEAQQAFASAIAQLSARGHEVEDAAFTYDPGYPDVFTTSWTAGLSRLRLDDAAVDRLMPLTRTFRERALARGDDMHRAAGSRLREFASDVRTQWGAYDAVLTPGLAMLPPRIGAFTSHDADGDYRLQCEWAPYTSMVNVSGLPAVAVPIVRLPSGHSMGVQLIGRTGSEALLLQLAAQLMER